MSIYSMPGSNSLFAFDRRSQAGTGQDIAQNFDGWRGWLIFWGL